MVLRTDCLIQVKYIANIWITGRIKGSSLFILMIDQSSSLTDQELVQAALQNPEAFECIVNRYWNRLFSYIRRTTYFTQEDVEDVLQEVFIKVYRYLNDFDLSMSFSTWMYQITRNAVIDEIRKKKARPMTAQLETEELMTMLRSSLDIHKQCFTNQSIEKVKQIIFSLPFKYQEVLVLRFLEEKNYEEIMDILQKPKGTVAALINRGRQLLINEAQNQDIL